jgi:hypothetical protein
MDQRKDPLSGFQ